MKTMTATEFNILWKAIDVLEAQELLNAFRLALVPRLKDSSRKEREKELMLKAFPREIYKRATKDVNFLLQKLGGPNGRRK